ncbi:hypothetical protein [Desulfovermiculus halophilus]|jgi:hypothetical protein|uniref:hypothetical protein n=1 Tax=Desulfovermiculus halophilus TaxID=339722 RepID=UPI0004822E94|nr:hypothetical protein [Desulfovermiculus halophilus]
MKRILEKIDTLLMASVMAEANAHELGRQYLRSGAYSESSSRQESLQDFLSNVGLDSVQVYYGIARL